MEPTLPSSNDGSDNRHAIPALSILFLLLLGYSRFRQDKQYGWCRVLYPTPIVMYTKTYIILIIQVFPALRHSTKKYARKFQNFPSNSRTPVFLTTWPYTRSSVLPVPYRYSTGVCGCVRREEIPFSYDLVFLHLFPSLGFSSALGTVTPSHKKAAHVNRVKNIFRSVRFYNPPLICKHFFRHTSRSTHFFSIIS